MATGAGAAEASRFVDATVLEMQEAMNACAAEAPTFDNVYVLSIQVHIAVMTPDAPLRQYAVMRDGEEYQRTETQTHIEKTVASVLSKADGTPLTKRTDFISAKILEGIGEIRDSNRPVIALGATVEYLDKAGESLHKLQVEM